jgi:hypothetical protein
VCRLDYSLGAKMFCTLNRDPETGKGVGVHKLARDPKVCNVTHCNYDKIGWDIGE